MRPPVEYWRRVNIAENGVPEKRSPGEGFNCRDAKNAKRNIKQGHSLSGLGVRGDLAVQAARAIVRLIDPLQRAE